MVSFSFLFEMFQNLKELQQKNARIIIADVYDERSEVIMCEAYKLKVREAVFCFLTQNVYSLKKKQHLVIALVPPLYRLFCLCFKPYSSIVEISIVSSHCQALNRYH